MGIHSVDLMVPVDAVDQSRGAAHVRVSIVEYGDYAEVLGLDMPLFRASLDDQIYRQRVREQMDGAIRSHLRATPGFYVNGRVRDISGGMQTLVDRVRSLL